MADEEEIMAKLEFIKNSIALKLLICSSYKACCRTTCRHIKPHTVEECSGRGCPPYSGRGCPPYKG